jgi:hypothetical protein
MHCTGDTLEANNPISKFEVTGSLTTETGPGGGNVVQGFSCNDVKCALLSNPTVIGRGCVQITGEIQTREFGAGFHVSIVGAALQRVRVQTTGLYTHVLEPVRVCWPGKYTMQFRLDYLWNQGLENCTATWPPTNQGSVPPLFMAQATIQFEVASSQDVLSNVATGTPQWVRLRCDNSDTGAQSGDLVQRACADLKQKNDTWAWLPALQQNMFTLQSVASALAELPIPHTDHNLPSYWMHWVSDSIALRGPMLVRLCVFNSIVSYGIL